MPKIVLPPGSSPGADESEPFTIESLSMPLGVSAFDFAGAEEVVIHRDRGDGVFRPVSGADSTMTSSDYETTISATGTYKIVRTEGTAGASIG